MVRGLDYYCHSAFEFTTSALGAQGAGPEDVRPGFTDGLSGAIVNSSRGIAFAYRKAETADWRAAADRAMDEMLEGLRTALG